MTIGRQPQPRKTYAELEQEVAMWRDVFTAKEWADSFARFHALDGVVNDSCPCCGGPIVLDHSDVVRIDEHGHRAPQGTRLVWVR